MIKFLENLKQYDLPFTEAERLSKWHLAPVDFNDIFVTQEQLDRFDVNHVLDIYHSFHPALVRPPSMVYINEQLVCWDGHHTAVVCLLKGFAQCPAVIYEADNWDFKTTPTVEKFDEKQLTGLYESLPFEVKQKLINTL